MPKAKTTGQQRRTAARFQPTATEAASTAVPAVMAGATRKAVVEYRGGWVTHDHVPELADPALAAALRALADESESERGTRYGKAWCSGMRRRTLQVSDSGAAYRYAGSAWQGRPVRRFIDTPAVAAVRDVVERATGARFNFVLLNFYNDEGALGWHQDDEKGHAPGAPIASVSVCPGAPWAFDLRAKNDGARRWRLPLATGDLAVMGGACQQELEHCVPALKRAEGDWRINLTFRQFVQ